MFCSLIAAGPAVTSHISASDQTRFDTIFAEGLRSRDIQSIYYTALSFQKIARGESKVVCLQLIDTYNESKLNEFERNFYFVGIFRQLKCNLPFPGKFEAAIRGSLDKDAKTIAEVYFNYFATRLLTEKDIPEETKAKVAKNLLALLKKDDSLTSLGYSFHLAVDLGSHASSIVDRIEDAIAQADEVDGRMLQFEGGLSTTALVLNGALKLTKANNKPLPISAAQALKFSNYLLSRRSVQSAKGISVLLEVLSTLADTSVAPICIETIGNGQLSTDSPVVNVKVVNLIGKQVPTMTAVSGKVASKKSPTTVLVANQAFVAKSSDNTVFALDLTTAKPSAGAYTVDVTAGTYTQQLVVKVLGKVRVDTFELGIGDADSSTGMKTHKLVHPNKAKEALAADAQQKIVMKWVLVEEASKKPMLVHQAFVRFENAATNEEIIFVAEPDSTKTYRFDLDLSVRGVDFVHRSGKYAVELIVGDAAISNSFRWSLGEVSLKFGQEEKPKAECQLRKMKPEIKHMFREPEKRPPMVVSNLFTLLCAAPLAVLLIVWLKLKVNISAFPLSLSAVGFHGGLGAILFLFFVFWKQLNMFETIKYLLPLGLFTFICGNRLLRAIAARKEK